MVLLDITTPQDKLENIPAKVITGMTNNKTYLVEVDGYGAIYANDQTENKFYIVMFTSVTYTLQENIESDEKIYSLAMLSTIPFIYNLVYQSRILCSTRGNIIACVSANEENCHSQFWC